MASQNTSPTAISGKLWHWAKVAVRNPAVAAVGRLRRLRHPHRPRPLHLRRRLLQFAGQLHGNPVFPVGADQFRADLDICDLRRSGRLVRPVCTQIRYRNQGEKS